MKWRITSKALNDAVKANRFTELLELVLTSDVARARDDTGRIKLLQYVVTI